MVLYHGWIGGRLLSNAGAYLPLITDTQANEIQTACNSAARAVAGLPKRGKYPMTEVRKSLNIDSVKNVTRINLLHEGWKARPSPKPNRRITRCICDKKIRLPKKTGWTGKKISTKRLEAWNELPLEIKLEENNHKAKALIKKFVRQDKI